MLIILNHLQGPRSELLSPLEMRAPIVFRQGLPWRNSVLFQMDAILTWELCHPCLDNPLALALSLVPVFKQFQPFNLQAWLSQFQVYKNLKSTAAKYSTVTTHSLPSTFSSVKKHNFRELDKSVGLQQVLP